MSHWSEDRSPELRLRVPVVFALWPGSDRATPPTEGLQDRVLRGNPPGYAIWARNMNRHRYFADLVTDEELAERSVSQCFHKLIPIRRQPNLLDRRAHATSQRLYLVPIRITADDDL